MSLILEKYSKMYTENLLQSLVKKNNNSTLSIFSFYPKMTKKQQETPKFPKIKKKSSFWVSQNPSRKNSFAPLTASVTVLFESSKNIPKNKLLCPSKQKSLFIQKRFSVYFLEFSKSFTYYLPCFTYKIPPFIN